MRKRAVRLIKRRRVCNSRGTMKILVVSENFYPDTFAINDIVRILVERGHQVTVLTGLPDYTTSLIPDDYKHGQNRHQNYFGAEVYRVPTIARRHGPLWRSLNYLSFVFSGNRAAKKRNWDDFDVIYVWEVSPVTMGIPAIKLKKRYNKPIFLYCMDIWPECVKAMGFKERTLPYRLITRISKYVYNNCDHIAVSSSPFFKYLEETDGCDRTKMSYLPQFASSDLLKEDHAKVPNGHYDFLYIGNIGKAQDMGCMIRAIAKLKDRQDVTFHFIGGGSAYEETQNLAKKTGANRIIKFYGPKPFNEAKKYYSLADACILTLDGSTHIGDTLPGKIQTYMAAGKPVIGAMNGAGKEIIQESKCGYCVPAGDSDGLTSAFERFMSEPDQYIKYGNAARKYFTENFTQELYFSRLEKELSRLIS